MSVLNSRILAQIRATTAQFLKDTCLIEVQSDITDEFGGQPVGWQIVAEDVPCRVITAGYQNSSRSELVGQQESMMDLYKLICPAGTPLAPNQRVTVNGIVYNVVQLMTARTDESDTSALITRQM